MALKDRLAETFREALELSGDIDIPGLKYQAISEWNSIGHMQLVAAMEGTFDIMLDTDEIIDMSSFAKALELLGKHGVADD